MNPVLSVIFINYNSERYLEAALSSFVRYHRDFPYEIIIVDNSSKDRTKLKDLEIEFNANLILLDKNIGYGPAANRGLHVSKGKYLAVANPDLVFIDDSAKRIVDYMDNHPEVGAVIPQYLNPDMSLQPSSRKFPTFRYLLFARTSFISRIWKRNPFTKEYLGLRDIDLTKPQKVEVGMGAFLVLRKTALDKIGLFDEDFFLFSEDTDICYRLRSEGFDVILLPYSRVIHYHGVVRRRSKVAPRSRFWRMKSVWLFIKKHGFFPSWVIPLLGIGLIVSTGLDGFFDLTGILRLD